LDSTITTNFLFLTNQPVVYPGIIISNSLKNYVIAGPGHIRGITGLYKTGPGTCTLETSNDFIGNVIIDNGTLAVTNVGVNPNLVCLGIAGGGQMENDVILDGGTLSYVGTTNETVINQFVFNPGGGTINVASATNTLLFNGSKKQIVGQGGITKTGPGIMALFNTADNYQGGTTVNGGTLMMWAAGAGLGGIALNNTTTLSITNNLALTNTLAINGPATTIQVFGTTFLTNNISSPWTGSGTVVLATTNVFVFSGNLTGFSGTLSAGTNAGIFQFNIATNKNPCLGSAAATFDLGTGSAMLQTFNGSNLTYSLGALSGGSKTVLSGRNSGSASPPGTVYAIGANGLSTTFSGTITNGADTVSVIKVGTGSLLLNGISTYTGPTTVSNGILGGTGSIASALAVVAGGTLSPGPAVPGVGTFTVSNNAVLGGQVVMKLNQANPGVTNDLLKVTGTLTVSGSLVVTNVGPNLTNGATFKLFSQAVSGFGSITLPTGGGSYVWQTNLAVDGSIKLVSGGVTTINTNPTNIVATVTNGVLTLTWPADHTGWRLQVETNPLSVGLTNNWFTVPNSTNVNSATVPMDAHQGSIFYRLTYP
jgi:autotransporter-associated beta strand protein